MSRSSQRRRDGAENCVLRIFLGSRFHPLLLDLHQTVLPEGMQPSPARSQKRCPRTASAEQCMKQNVTISASSLWWSCRGNASCQRAFRRMFVSSRSCGCYEYTCCFVDNPSARARLFSHPRPIRLYFKSCASSPRDRPSQVKHVTAMFWKQQSFETFTNSPDFLPAYQQLVLHEYQHLQAGFWEIRQYGTL